ncbi:MAG: hypothetical protein IPF87_24930 [Gemmatimonadetes bacterium]|nr:hypothetical protein [Gemmatimonadota bacterium]
MTRMLALARAIIRSSSNELSTETVGSVTPATSPNSLAMAVADGYSPLSISARHTSALFPR